MGILEDYIDYLTRYQTLYGQRTIVLYQNGSFFEVYGVDNEKEKIGLVREISNMLNIQMTRRNKSIITNDRSNFLLAGFPLNQLDRYITILTEDNGYVVVIVEQVSDPPNPKRDVTNVISPGTNIRHLSHPHGNFLLSIYLENEGKKIKQIKPIDLLTVGLSAIDVSTGHSLVYEVANTIDDEKRAFDETYRMIQTLQPREIIVNSRGYEVQDSFFDNGQALIHCQNNQVSPDYYKLSYQNEFLSKVFTQTGMLKPIEYLNLEQQPTGLISYLLLLNYCYEQKETIIKQIDRPDLLNNQQFLILDNNCINQLNMMSSTGNQKCSSVFNLVDQTSTPMGKRLLQERLLMPLVEINSINERYDCLEFFRQPLSDMTDITSASDESKVLKAIFKHLPGHQQIYRFQQVEHYLKGVCDLERYHRKICMGLLQPSEFAQLHQSYQLIEILLQILIQSLSQGKGHETLHPGNLVSQMREYMNYYTTILNLEEASKQNMGNLTTSFFCRGYHSEIDRLQTLIDGDQQYFQQIAKHISQTIGSGDKLVVSVDHTEDLGYHLGLTVTRYKVYQTKIASLSSSSQHLNESNPIILIPQNLECLTNRAGKTCRLTSPEMKEISIRLKDTQKHLLERVVAVYKDFLSQLYSRYKQLMKQVTQWIALIDFYKSNAKTSLLYHYCRPHIVQKIDGSQSSLHLSQVRHPLIERIQETCQYVPQNVDFDHEKSGILLFGVNCSGKSSLMKAIGITIIMAQAGLYVPATTMTYIPYHSILTRIVGNDNLFKGLSSFAVEMGELRGILRRANQFSMVLGDEICHGTETISAVSLVASAVITLSQNGVNFLFATHLHTLSQMNRITTLPSLRMFHLKVRFDQQSGHLIYDRHLESGAGHPIYGLEVAKAMDLDPQFLDLANEIRKELMEIDPLVPLKKSKYNSHVYLDNCGIPGCCNPATLTHHIQFQSEADETGFINNHLQKNHRSNLIPLCQQCHDKIHDQQPGHERYIIHGYQMASDGLYLDFEKIQNPCKKKLKLRSPQIAKTPKN